MHYSNITTVPGAQILIGKQSFFPVIAGFGTQVFHVDFSSVQDRISRQFPTIVFDATRFAYLVSGTTFGANLPIIESDGDLLGGGGAYTQLVELSEDPSDIASGINATYANNVFTVPDDGSYLQKPTLSFNITALNVGDKHSCDIYNVTGTGTCRIDANRNGGTFEQFTQQVVLSATPQTITIPMEWAFGDHDGMYMRFTPTDGTFTVNDDFKIQVTASAYRLPYVPNTTTGTISVPLNYSDATHGIKYSDIQDDFPLLDTALTSEMEMEILWTPQFDYDQTTGTGNIVSCDDATPGMVYHDDDGTITLADGTGTVSVDPNYQGGTQYEIKLIAGTHPTETLSAEKVEEGTFDGADDGDPWVTGVGWAIAGGKLNGTATTANTTQTFDVVAGESYEITFDITDYTSGSVRINLGSSLGTARSTVDTHTETLVAPLTTGMSIDGYAAFTGSVDNVSIKRLGQPKMQIIVTEVDTSSNTWSSSVVDFDGSFNPGDNFSIAWENDYFAKYDSIKVWPDPITFLTDFDYVVDSNGNKIVDSSGNYVIASRY